MCPWIESSEKQCAEHLTFGNLAHVFAHCAGDYTACPVYQQLNAEQDDHIQAERDALLRAS